MERQTILLLLLGIGAFFLLCLGIEALVQYHRRRLIKELRRRFIIRRQGSLRNVVNCMSYVEVKETYKKLLSGHIHESIREFLNPRACVS